jgi:hypothetical protein
MPSSGMLRRVALVRTDVSWGLTQTKKISKLENQAKKEERKTKQRTRK